jgi:hypothetical protein
LILFPSDDYKVQTIINCVKSWFCSHRKRFISFKKRKQLVLLAVSILFIKLQPKVAAISQDFLWDLNDQPANTLTLIIEEESMRIFLFLIVENSMCFLSFTEFSTDHVP